MHAIVYRGWSGCLRWGYTEAASLGAWTLSADASGSGQLTATIRTVDHFRVTQSPLVFVAPRPAGEWRWPVESLTIQGSDVTATLGLPL